MSFTPYFNKAYHSNSRHNKLNEDQREQESKSQSLVSKWSQKEKIKTSAVALVLCLNIGVDPPGVIKISPYAKKQCWIDPTSMRNYAALEAITKNLQIQYERLQRNAKYKQLPDPIIDQVKRGCISLRKSANKDRVLFHYNGHGVPKPTNNGEIWVFNSHYTKYIPLPIYELQSWIENPVIYVFDCPSAGTIINSIKSFIEHDCHNLGQQRNGGYSPFSELTGDPMKDIIILGASSVNESLVDDPEMPADLFTSCLTTPLKIALRWYLPKSIILDKILTVDMLDDIPGSVNDRKTILGELNWIYTAITDTIAWNILPRDLFQKLFRQDLLVASLFRNFLLAEYIMSTYGVMPISYPRLPVSANHPLWKTWECTIEEILIQIPKLTLKDPPITHTNSSFFSDQLDSFELWLKLGSVYKPPPMQLPIILQVLLSPIHRNRALNLLHKFFEMGHWAVDHALSVGIFPYLLKLLQTNIVDLQDSLIYIWAKILALDSTCQFELVKEKRYWYFLKFLDTCTGSYDLRSNAAFIMSVICDRHQRGQEVCLEGNLPLICIRQLSSENPDENDAQKWNMWRWICICLGKLCENNSQAIVSSAQLDIPDVLIQMVHHAPDAELRASAIYALNCFIFAEYAPHELQPFEFQMADRVLDTAIYLLYDGSIVVRAEIAVLLSKLVEKPGNKAAFEASAEAMMQNAEKQVQSLVKHLYSVPYHIFQKVGSNQQMASNESSSSSEKEMTTQNTDIVRWANDDAAQVRNASLSPSEDCISSHYNRTLISEDEQASASYSNYNVSQQTQDCQISRYHKVIIEALCILATDPSHQVSEIALNALHKLNWDLQILLNTGNRGFIKHKYSTQTIWQSPSMPSRLRALRSHESVQMSVKTESSNGSGLRDIQIQAQMLQTRIDLASKYCQRTPFALKKMHESGSFSCRSNSDSQLSPMVARSSLRAFFSQKSIIMTSAHLSDKEKLSQSFVYQVSKLTILNSKTNESMNHNNVFHNKNYEIKYNKNILNVNEYTLRRDVKNVRTSADNIGSMILDNEESLVAVSSREGMIHIYNYGKLHTEEINSFHCSDPNNHSIDKDPFGRATDPVVIYSLNTNQSINNLMICNADGSVYTWKMCLAKNEQYLASSWQSVPLCLPPSFILSPAVYEWNPIRGELYSSGNSVPGIIFKMNLIDETLMQQFVLDQNHSIAVRMMKCFPGNPELMSLISDDNMVRIFDIRTNACISMTQPFLKHQTIGSMCMVEDVTSPKIIIMSLSGDMKYYDVRNMTSTIDVALNTKHQLKAHAQGGTSAMVAHPVYPIIASATLHPIIKIWNSEAQQVSAIRPSKNAYENCQKAISCMTFHPREMILGAGGKGHICGIYKLERYK